MPDTLSMEFYDRPLPRRIEPRRDLAAATPKRAPPFKAPEVILAKVPEVDSTPGSHEALLNRWMPAIDQVAVENLFALGEDAKVEVLQALESRYEKEELRNPSAFVSKECNIRKRHSVDPLSTDKRKTSLCKYYSSVGLCANGDKCNFAHGEDELREFFSGVGDTRQAASWQSQWCENPLGTASRFSHYSDGDILFAKWKSSLPDKAVADLRSCTPQERESILRRFDCRADQIQNPSSYISRAIEKIRSEAPQQQPPQMSRIDDVPPELLSILEELMERWHPLLDNEAKSTLMSLNGVARLEILQYLESKHQKDPVRNPSAFVFKPCMYKKQQTESASKPSFKTKQCWHFAKTGNCSLGDCCGFAHGDVSSQDVDCELERLMEQWSSSLDDGARIALASVHPSTQLELLRSLEAKNNFQPVRNPSAFVYKECSYKKQQQNSETPVPHMVPPRKIKPAKPADKGIFAACDEEFYEQPPPPTSAPPPSTLAASRESNKNVLCWHFKTKGECHMGAMCRFAHGEGDLLFSKWQGTLTSEVQVELRNLDLDARRVILKNFDTRADLVQNPSAYLTRTIEKYKMAGTFPGQAWDDQAQPQSHQALEEFFQRWSGLLDKDAMDALHALPQVSQLDVLSALESVQEKGTVRNPSAFVSKECSIRWKALGEPTKSANAPKMKMCRLWSTIGSCLHGDKCTFAHGDDELLAPIIPGRAGSSGPGPCRHFLARGECKLGSSCRFSHDPDVRSWVDSEPRRNSPQTDVTQHESSSADILRQIERIKMVVGSKAKSSNEQFLQPPAENFSLEELMDRWCSSLDKDAMDNLLALDITIRHDVLLALESVHVKEPLRNPSAFVCKECAARTAQSSHQVREEPKLGNQKAKLCKHWVTGTCVNADQCTFAHGEGDLQASASGSTRPSAPEIKQVIPCWNFVINGGCQVGSNCKFAHGDGDMLLNKWRPSFTDDVIGGLTALELEQRQAVLRVFDFNADSLENPTDYLKQACENVRITGAPYGYGEEPPEDLTCLDTLMDKWGCILDQNAVYALKTLSLNSRLEVLKHLEALQEAGPVDDAADVTMRECSAVTQIVLEPPEATIENNSIVTPAPTDVGKPIACWHYQVKGVCQNGADCKFGHGDADLILAKWRRCLTDEVFDELLSLDLCDRQAALQRFEARRDTISNPSAYLMCACANVKVAGSVADDMSKIGAPVNMGVLEVLTSRWMPSLDKDACCALQGLQLSAQIEVLQALDMKQDVRNPSAFVFKECGIRKQLFGDASTGSSRSSQPNEFSKSIRCWHFENKGGCHVGVNCKFAHGDADVLLSKWRPTIGVHVAAELLTLDVADRQVILQRFDARAGSIQNHAAYLMRACTNVKSNSRSAGDLSGDAITQLEELMSWWSEILDADATKILMALTPAERFDVLRSLQSRQARETLRNPSACVHQECCLRKQQSAVSEPPGKLEELTRRWSSALDKEAFDLLRSLQPFAQLEVLTIIDSKQDRDVLNPSALVFKESNARRQYGSALSEQELNLKVDKLMSWWSGSLDQEASDALAALPPNAIYEVLQELETKSECEHIRDPSALVFKEADWRRQSPGPVVDPEVQNSLEELMKWWIGSLDEDAMDALNSLPRPAKLEVLKSLEMKQEREHITNPSSWVQRECANRKQQMQPQAQPQAQPMLQPQSLQQPQLISPAVVADTSLGAPWKMRLCWHFSSKGVCPVGDKCNFAHGEQELSTTKDSQEHIMETDPMSVLHSGPEADRWINGNVALRTMMREATTELTSKKVVLTWPIIQQLQGASPEAALQVLQQLSEENPSVQRYPSSYIIGALRSASQGTRATSSTDNGRPRSVTEVPDDAQKKPTKKSKSLVCKDFVVAGSCKNGDDCPFAHVRLNFGNAETEGGSEDSGEEPAQKRRKTDSASEERLRRLERLVARATQDVPTWQQLKAQWQGIIKKMRPGQGAFAVGTSSPNAKLIRVSDTPRIPATSDPYQSLEESGDAGNQQGRKSRTRADESTLEQRFLQQQQFRDHLLEARPVPAQQMSEGQLHAIVAGLQQQGPEGIPQQAFQPQMQQNMQHQLQAQMQQAPPQVQQQMGPQTRPQLSPQEHLVQQQIRTQQQFLPARPQLTPQEHSAASPHGFEVGSLWANLASPGDAVACALAQQPSRLVESNPEVATGTHAADGEVVETPVVNVFSAGLPRMGMEPEPEVPLPPGWGKKWSEKKHRFYYFRVDVNGMAAEMENGKYKSYWREGLLAALAADNEGAAAAAAEAVSAKAAACKRPRDGSVGVTAGTPLAVFQNLQGTVPCGAPATVPLNVASLAARSAGLATAAQTATELCSGSEPPQKRRPALRGRK